MKNNTILKILFLVASFVAILAQIFHVATYELGTLASQITTIVVYFVTSIALIVINARLWGTDARE